MSATTSQEYRWTFGRPATTTWSSSAPAAPAAATARLLAARVTTCSSLDRGDLPSDTLSTHGIARGGVVQLARWGLLDEVLASGAPAVREVTFGPRAGGDPALKNRAGVDLLVAPRRTVLDRILARRRRRWPAPRCAPAMTSQACCATEHGRVAGVTARTRDGQRPRLHARHVVGADGLRSTMAGLSVRGSSSPSTPTSRSSTPTSTRCLAAGSSSTSPTGAYAGVFPTHDGQAASGCAARPRSPRTYEGRAPSR